jgi:hypothetical protein
MGEAGSCSDVRPTFQMLGMTFNTSLWLDFEGEFFVSSNGLAATADSHHLPALVDTQQTLRSLAMGNGACVITHGG